MNGNILIVDDMPEILRLLAHMLKINGYHVRTLPHGRMVLPAILSNPPDLILLDIRMPDVDGFAICTQLKKDPRTREIPVIFISAVSGLDDRVRGFSLGAVDYITKPFQEEEVLARVNTQISLRKAQMRLNEKNRDLQKSEARYRNLVENFPGIIYSYFMKKGGFYVSSRVESLIGYSARYLMDNPFFWYNSIHPDDRQKVDKVIQKFSTGQDFAIEYRIRNRSGAWRWVYDRSIGRQVENDEIIIEGMVIDITQRKEAERSLADSERRLAQIIDFLPDPTWVIDTEGRVMAWNRAMERLTAVKKEDILMQGDYAHSLPMYGKRRPALIDLVLKRDVRWEKEYIDFEEGDQGLLSGVSFHPHMGERGRYFASSAITLFDTRGRVMGAIESVRDITAAKHWAQDRERLISELQDALNSVQTLRGLLPICASCKKIRDDKGYWNQIESYISRHSEAAFSHGICPDCEDKLYGHQKWFQQYKQKRDKNDNSAMDD